MTKPTFNDWEEITGLRFVLKLVRLREEPTL